MLIDAITTNDFSKVKDLKNRGYLIGPNEVALLLTKGGEAPEVVAAKKELSEIADIMLHRKPMKFEALAASVAKPLNHKENEIGRVFQRLDDAIEKFLDVLIKHSKED